jgi:hypothetical protein
MFIYIADATKPGLYWNLDGEGKKEACECQTGGGDYGFGNASLANWRRVRVREAHHHRGW